MPRPDRFVLDSKTKKFLQSVSPLEPQSSLKSPSSELIGKRLLKGGSLAEAEACFRRACSEPKKKDPDRRDAIQLQLCRSLLDRSNGEAIALLRPLVGRDSVDAACAYNILGAALLGLAEFELAEINFEKAIACSGRPHKDRFSMAAVGNLARVCFCIGDVDRAKELHQQAFRELTKHGHRNLTGFLLANMAVHATLLECYDDAFRYLSQARRVQDDTGNVHLRVINRLAQAELELVTGSINTGLELVVETERIARINAPSSAHAKALVLKSVVDSGPTEQALKDWRATARDLRQRNHRSDSSLLHILTGSVLRVCGTGGERDVLRGRTLMRNSAEAAFLEAHYGRLATALSQPQRKPLPRQPFPNFITRAPAILKIKKQLKRLVNTDVRVLLEGESGTGKTFLARQIHDAGKGAKSPFVVVDCTNLDEHLFESKLFGHRRGSFTGAVTDRVGLVEQADKGSLFLDEIGEVPLEIQAKLLYTIEEGKYRPVGAKVEKSSDFRVLAATNRDVDDMLESGALREDLFFRLAGYRVELPPLRDRSEDIAPLVERRLTELNEKYNRKKTLQPAAWEAIERHTWPGNVRELNSTLERGFHLATGRRVGVDDLGIGLRASSMDPEDLSWYFVRRTHLLRVLRMCRGNVTRAAKVLGLNRTTLIYKLKLLDIERTDFDPSHAEPSQDEPKLRLVAEEPDSQ